MTPAIATPSTMTTSASASSHQWLMASVRIIITMRSAGGEFPRTIRTLAQKRSF
jgi:hypothetical protein